MFITFEGADGSGKTTQLKMFADYMEHRFDNVQIGRQPGGTNLGTEIRRLLLSSEYSPCSETELFLFLADRAQHVREIIQPCLENKGVYICDRYSHSTMAYQLAARGLDGDHTSMIDMISSAECGVSPDVVVWIDTDIDMCIERIEMRSSDGSEEKNRLDTETREFHERVHKGFLKIFTEELGQTVVLRIDGNGTIEDVHNRVVAAVDKWYREK